MTQPVDESTAYRPPEETPTVRVASPPKQAFEQQLVPGTIVAGRYRIVSLVGRGGMGEVYRADDLKLGQTIALKFLSRRVADQQRLYEEVRIGRQISHPNVCRLYDVAEVEGRPFITMEFVDGEDLASLLRRIGRLPHDKALSVTRDLCAGLGAAHEKGVIHRDLKPGNVMIDGRGRARITDFGLAVIERNAREEVSAGTPAYMAPEQLAGEPVTVRSDLYALGLILYEVFTGHRTFQAVSVTDLAALQHERRFLRPTAVVPDVSPQVERAILHALEPDSDSRPPSVEALLGELPHYDPLKAAIAAGETPTPGMVAAADARGDLSPAVAWTLLVAVIGGLALVTALSRRSMLIAQIPQMKPPEVLLERAREIVAEAGMREPPADTFYAYFIATEYRNALGRGDAVLGETTATPIGFYYRQSPRPLVAMSWRRRPWQDDPPLVVPGMVDIQLTAAGHLTSVTVVPPQRDTAPAGTVDWTRFFDRAGIDPKTLVPVQPEWAAQVDSDRKQGWLIGKTGARVETASYHGRPVSFDVIFPWQTAWRMRKASNDLVVRLYDIVLGFFVVAIPLTGLFLARRNLLRGQGDRRGALRLAIAFFIALSAGLLLLAHHVTSFIAEWGITVGLIAQALLWSTMLAIGYIAVEPLVRRRWPHILISWTRMLNGQFSDALFGRDLLFGAVAGILCSVLWHLTALVPRWLGLPAAPLQKGTMTLGELKYTLFYYVLGVGGALIGGIAIVTLLLLLRALTRSDRVAVVITVLMLSIFYIDAGTGPLGVRAAYALLVTAIALTVLLRFGLVAIGACSYFTWMLWYIPLTFDTSRWYFGRSMVALLALLAIASYGFYVSVRGKAFLPRLAFEG